MVVGLELFRKTFADFSDQYVLIGGTAASLAMEESGLEFRTTKDLDIVLHIEALTAAFGRAFWQFVGDAGYKILQASEFDKPIFYRFQKPANDRYPTMLELFSRTPDGFQLAPDSHLTPIPMDEAVSSLSAILLDDTYYRFIMAGRHEKNGLSLVGEDRLIPLKAVAWLELSERKAQGKIQVDAKNVRKHANDVLRLAQLLSAAHRTVLGPKIRDDMQRFLDSIAGDADIDPKKIGIRHPTKEMLLERIADAFGLEIGKAVHE
ncbi:MAG: nucleotidyl transferase AbiEii/AbiGii toxin family protein [Rhodocyclaceae bacterium]|nr:nucleotidyl transferase AbiEii/AbiGii toxin family protein [Rhodocyclaceae bacterium]